MGALNGSKILIGREDGGSRLQIAVYKQGKRIYVNVPTMTPVANCVSRLNLNNHIGHCEIIVDPAGQMYIRNLKPQNVTFVDGMCIAEKQIFPYSNVCLGEYQYPLDLNSVLTQAEMLAAKIDRQIASQGGGMNPGGMNNGKAGNGGQSAKETVDIRHLEQMYQYYEDEKAAIMKKKKNLTLVASITPIFTIGGSVLAIGAEKFGIQGDAKSITIVFMGLAIVVMLISFWLRFTDKSDQQLKELTETFQHNYNCPKCGRFLGMQPYFLVKQMKKCPGCGREFRG
ncbi:MAG: FHA domain-containing protein [Muribaculaceae bacterium]|nr:FHA domain-containing protein [Muribaculaceae bacterium]